MFKLIPQLVVFFSILSIIIIVLRRLPEVTVAEEDGQDLLPESVVGFGPKKILDALSTWSKKIVTLFLAYAKAAKEHSGKVNYLERFSKALRLDPVRPRFKAKQTAGGALDANVLTPDTASLDQSEKILIEIIQKNPSDKSAYENLGKLYLDRNKYTDAEEVYEYLTRNYPQEDAYFSKLGTVYFNLKKFDQAANAYNSAIALRGDLPNRYINLGLSHEAMGDFAAAAQAVRKALEKSPDNLSYLALLSEFLIKAGQTAGAQEILERILELEPTNAQARQRLMGLKF